MASCAPSTLYSPHRRESATDKEHQMSLLQGLRLYTKVMAWSILISTCICMQGYDICLLSNFYAFPQFIRKYGEQLADGTFLACGAEERRECRRDPRALHQRVRLGALRLPQDRHGLCDPRRGSPRAPQAIASAPQGIPSLRTPVDGFPSGTADSLFLASFRGGYGEAARHDIQCARLTSTTIVSAILSPSATAGSPSIADKGDGSSAL
ncbi:hypothetical protein C8R44DRAFT_865045 [Mycena epipterygia]|nr:hypothetical protein C8R44DRAFT_865045 [Mycena epipterygia]